MYASLPPNFRPLPRLSLQVYSAPSGKFKAHVDTPRGPTQFGSLVVCLPHRHQGGELSIRHGSSVSKEMRFNWNDQEAEIRWAAFYSDCEHEVKEVTAGHRVTLTYNLYAHEQVGGILRHPSPVDTDSFALYRCAKEALANSDFLPTGESVPVLIIHYTDLVRWHLGIPLCPRLCSHK